MKMTYSLPTNDVELFLSELNKIRRGIHHNFIGDGVYNSEAVISSFCRNNKDSAFEMASKLDAYLKPNNFHPSRIKGFAKTIRRTLIVQAL